ncbi:hypothetical protein BL105A_1387 [Bifidobacterium longum]|nr:hypothetical protein BL105A_1387 [Bifidobacterium longum]
MRPTAAYAAATPTTPRPNMESADRTTRARFAVAATSQPPRSRQSAHSRRRAMRDSARMYADAQCRLHDV